MRINGRLQKSLRGTFYTHKLFLIMDIDFVCGIKDSL